MFDEMKIASLFGNFNYNIKWKDEGVTIITGPNGFGKSTILKIIDALYNGDTSFFVDLDFKEVSIVNKDELVLLIKKTEKNLIIGKNSLPLDMKRLRTRHISGLIEAENSWEELVDLSERVMKHYVDDMVVYREMPVKNKIIEQVKMAKKAMKEASGEVRFIKEQRLIAERETRRNDKKLINVIEDLPNNFKQIISEVSNKYSSTANELDSSYPSRLFSTSVGIAKEDYTEKMVAMTERFQKLAKFNISDIQPPQNVEFLVEHAKALKVYFDDFEAKYEVFKEFINQLEMFTEIVNSRLKFKEVKISRENGIEVFKNGDDPKKLELHQLSSGEKQEIVLFYDLIFKIDHDVHLLIDEPEISLHIEWQLKFMNDLLKIAKHKNLKVTVATHSPQIINNHWDIQIDLGEMYGG